MINQVIIITNQLYVDDTFAVPDIVLVSGVVYLICKNTAIFIRNPVIPVSVITTQKDGSFKNVTFSRTPRISPETKISGSIIRMAIAVL
jgi:hypothetical protein